MADFKAVSARNRLSIAYFGSNPRWGWGKKMIRPFHRFSPVVIVGEAQQASFSSSLNSNTTSNLKESGKEYIVVTQA
ncbi:hypothetical protein [Cyclobacterium amurskyense]|uniref:hypothetical protein n=1 Tax=Cyclobacterium amurskyense TaxID=320787 RepID=UPI0012F82EC6|nr:hypothetical protein [Cyclobacterium amurskyense]